MKKLTCSLAALAVIAAAGVFLSGCPTPQGGGSSLSSDAGLSDLSVIWVGLGPLSLDFTSGTTTYDLDVPNSLDRVSVTAATNSSAASIKIDGNSATSGHPETIALTQGGNQIIVDVTAEDGVTTESYVVSVTRAAPDPTNAGLAGLILSEGHLQPVFSENTLSYSASVGLAVDAIRLTPFLSDGNAAVKVNGSSAAHAAPFGPVALAVGDNAIAIEVTASNLTDTETYTITVNRAASTNASLSSLVLSQGSLTPAFDSTVTSYSSSVPYAVSSITVTPTTADSAATITVNGSPVISGQQSASISLSVGANVLTVAVTAQDATTTRTCTVTVNRAAPSSNANLSNLVPSPGSLSPPFSSSVTSYTASVANSVSSIAFTPTAADSAATITVNGSPVTSGQQSASIGLSVGANVLTVVVTAQDATTTKTYTVTVNRAAPPSISGTISRIGAETISSTSPLVVWWRKANSSVRGTTVYTTGSFPRTFSLPDMADGEYFVGAFLDKDNSGHSSAGDLFGQFSTRVVVSGASVSNVQFTIQTRSDGDIHTWSTNIPSEYEGLFIYFVVLAPEANVLTDPWTGYAYGMIIGGTCAPTGIDISSSSTTFAGGSCMIDFFLWFGPYPPSLSDLQNNPPYAGVLYGEVLAMIDGATLVGFNFANMVGFPP